MKRVRRLNTSAGILSELRSIYREHRFGDLSNDSAKTSMQLLRTMDAIIQSSDIETRLSALEMAENGNKRQV